MQPVFTLAIRTQTGQDQQSTPQQPDTATANSPITTATPQNNDTLTQNAEGVTASSNTSELESIQNNVSSNAVATSPGAMSFRAALVENFAGSDPDSKSNDEQPGGKQTLAELAGSAAPSGSMSSAGTQFQAVESRPVTEYVATDQTATTQTHAPMSEIRLQVDGGANEHVNVRLVQQTDGLRVTVHSSDPALTQSLQEHVPELTTRLEQHHYQTEVLLPGHNDSGHLNQSNSGANPQQDSSGRNHGSAGQGNPHNKQNQQQRQQARKEEENFASLLGSRR
jgi:hypothetical protein